MKLRKLWLNINGADRMITCDPEKDSLADVLRREGLTGVKVGCGTGVCGSCSVILNGEVIRSCTRKIKTVEDYSKVTTIEGVGTPTCLHPLQQAWITHGAAQCGFCSPAFIVSAYALLQQNNNPTRKQVREWFQKHRNICRCTGYKPLVDAVMDAAKVVRGEATMADITYKNPENGEYYGSPVPRPTAIAKVCGLAEYGDDVAQKMPEGTLYLAVIQPKKAHHARILKIDTSKAEKMEGVFSVITAKDVKGVNRLPAFNNHKRSTVVDPSHPIFCDEKIFRYGDIVGLVAADTKAHARAAAAAVEVELEQLPEYLTFLEASMPDAMRVHEDTPNVFIRQPVLKGEFEDVPEIIESSPYSVEGSFYASREPHLSLEGDICQAYFDDDGMLTVQCKAQAVYSARNAVAQAAGLPSDKVRIIMNTTGGSFGWSTAAPSFAATAVAAQATGHPVSLSMSWEEFQHHSGKRCACYTNARLSCDEKGKLTALEYDTAVDHGAYSDGGEGLITRFIRYMGWPYNIPNIMGLARMANTNHNFGVAYRGFGAPQITTASEAIMDMLAEKAGIDPFEFRYLNIARPGDTTPNSYPYREYPMEEIMDKARPYYETMKKRAKEHSTPEKPHGVGVAFGSYNCTGGKHDSAGSKIDLNPDGSVTVYNTWEDIGQGGDVGTVMFTLEALKPLGLTPEMINVKPINDSKLSPDSGIAGGSRSHMMNGYAICQVAAEMLNAMRKEDGSYRTYDEMVKDGLPTTFEGRYSNTQNFPELVEYSPDTGVGDPIPTYMYAMFLCEVEVDVATGKTTVVAYTSVADVGVIGNKASVDGQAYGGLSHSIGYALTEDYHDVKKHGNMAGAGIPQIMDIPDDFNLIYLENPRSRAPYGSSGCSELFQSSGHVAVLNAINNACGVRIYEIPALPAKVKAGLDALAKGEDLTPAPYFFGTDFYDEIDNIVANPVGAAKGPLQAE